MLLLAGTVMLRFAVPATGNHSVLVHGITGAACSEGLLRSWAGKLAEAVVFPPELLCPCDRTGIFLLQNTSTVRFFPDQLEFTNCLFE